MRIEHAGDHDLPPGEIGEVLVRGDMVMRGNWPRSRGGAETLRGGWLYTGDLGAFDEDGFLTLKDRSKDVIISGGSNIYSREIEEVLLRHTGCPGSLGRRPPPPGLGRGGGRLRRAPSRGNRDGWRRSTAYASTPSRVTNGPAPTSLSTVYPRTTTARW